ncbi:hypothetical protein MFUR16E_27875 [Methylobacterium fujisawaense]
MQSDTGCPRPHHAGDATADMMEHAAEEQTGLRVRIVVRGLVGLDERRHQMFRWTRVVAGCRRPGDGLLAGAPHQIA